MNNVDWKRFVFVVLYRATILAALVGVSVGITVLAAPALVPAVASWGGIIGGSLLGGSLLASVVAAGKDDFGDDAEDFDYIDEDEQDYESVEGKVCDFVLDKIDGLVGSIKHYKETKTAKKLAKKEHNANVIKDKLEEVKAKDTNLPSEEVETEQNVVSQNATPEQMVDAIEMHNEINNANANEDMSGSDSMEM